MRGDRGAGIKKPPYLKLDKAVNFYLVPKAGIEPARLEAIGF